MFSPLFSHFLIFRHVSYSFTGYSRKELKQRAISELLSNLAPQDMLLVSELSRLGRSVAQIIFLIDQMVQQQIRFVAIKEGIKLTGAQDLQTKVMVTLFSLFAEIERDLISERRGRFSSRCD